MGTGTDLGTVMGLGMAPMDMGMVDMGMVPVHEVEMGTVDMDMVMDMLGRAPHPTSN